MFWNKHLSSAHTLYHFFNSALIIAHVFFFFLNSNNSSMQYVRNGHWLIVIFRLISSVICTGNDSNFKGNK